MKRINPKTNKIFRYGDIRNDGFIFITYKKTLSPKNKYYMEQWASPKSFKNIQDKRALGLGRIKVKTGTGKFELNPKTGKKWNKGEKNSKGSFFWEYETWHTYKNGYHPVKWVSKEGLLKKKIHQQVNGARNRAKEYKLKFNLDTEYLYSIYPKDSICPALGVKMKHQIIGQETDKINFKEKMNSPSLDRINPKLGYVKGNVIWISLKANMIKQDATSEEIIKVGKWLKDL